MGFLHSDATYDVVHVWRGRFFRLNDHLDRFERGMIKLRMSLPIDRTGIRSILHDVVRASRLEDAYVEMICTRGLSAPGSRDPRDCVNQFYAFAFRLPGSPPRSSRNRDCRCTSARCSGSHPSRSTRR